MQRLVDGASGAVWVCVGATNRLLDDLVDDVEAEQIWRGQLEGLGRFCLLARVAPDQCGATLRRNDAVDRELLHQHPVADGDAERAAAATLAAHDDDDRRLEQHHVAQVDGNRLGDAAFLGLDARVGRRRIDEHDDWPAEFLRRLHHAHRLAVALGPGVAEVAEDLLLCVTPLDVADEQHVLSAVLGETGHDGVIVREAAVAVDLDKAREQALDVVLQTRPAGMTRDQHALPRRQVLIELAANRLDPALQ